MDSLYTKVASVTYEGRQSSLAKCAVGDEVRLDPEPNNPYDKYAVAVRVAAQDGNIYHIGYVPGDLARIIAPHLDGESISAKVSELTGGYEKWDGSRASLGLIIRVLLSENFNALN